MISFVVAAAGFCALLPPEFFCCEALIVFLFFLKRQTYCLFFFKYSPGREERCWEGLQCEICSGRARAEAAYEWVSVFRRCSMLLRTFYMNGVCLSAFRYQGDKDAASLLFFRRPVGFFFCYPSCYFIDLSWKPSHSQFCCSVIHTVQAGSNCFGAAERFDVNLMFYFLTMLTVN